MLLAGVLVVILAVVVVRGRGNSNQMAEDDTPVLPVGQRPFAELIPTEEGHYLDMKVSNINVPNAASMDYELFYGTATGITQGVPGKVKLEGKDSVDRPLLLGSESSGKFRYDEGVETGTLTLRFRDGNGKLIGKVTGQWHLQSGTDELTSLDGKFTYKLDQSSDAFFVTMPTFGLPDNSKTAVDGPYGVFTSSADALSGKVTLGGNIYMWDGQSWNAVSGGKADNVGVFITSQ